MSTETITMCEFDYIFFPIKNGIEKDRITTYFANYFHHSINNIIATKIFIK